MDVEGDSLCFSPFRSPFSFHFNEEAEPLLTDTIGKYTGDGHPKWWFAIWNMDKPEKADPIYRLLSDYDFFMWDFDENGDMEMPDFFVRKLNNPQCTYFQLHLVQP